MHDNILYLERMGWKATGGRNGQLHGRCPHRDHADKNPSFSINEVSGAFKCFSCGWKGQSAVTLMMGVEGISYEQAREKVYGTDISIEPTDRDAYLSVMSDCDRWYRAALRARQEPLASVVKPVLGYLADRRVSIDEFGIGYSGSQIIKFLSKNGHYENLKRLTPMTDDTGYYICDSRITIPITHNGQTIGFSMRSTDPDSKQHKYLNMVNTDLFPYNKWLFNLDNCKGASVRVTEGALDAMAVDGVALLGTNITPERVSLLHRFKEIYLLFDNDAGGWKAVEEFYFASRGTLPNSVIKVCSLPRDPDECRDSVTLYEKESLDIVHWLARTATRRRPTGLMVNEVRRLQKRFEEHYEISDVERVLLNDFLVVEASLSLFAPKLYGGNSKWTEAWSEMCRVVEKETGVTFFNGVKCGAESNTTKRQGDSLPSPNSAPPVTEGTAHEQN